MLMNISNTLGKIVAFLCVITMGSLAIIMILNVIFRYFVNSPIIWADEAVLFLFAWTAFLGASIGVQANNMAAVRILVEKFSGKVLKTLNIIIQLFVLGFGLILTYYSFKWWTAPSTINAVSPSLGVPMWIPTLMLPLGMLFITFFSLINILKILNDQNINEMEEY